MSALVLSNIQQTSMSHENNSLERPEQIYSLNTFVLRHSYYERKSSQHASFLWYNAHKTNQSWPHVHEASVHQGRRIQESPQTTAAIVTPCVCCSNLRTLSQPAATKRDCPIPLVRNCNSLTSKTILCITASPK